MTPSLPDSAAPGPAELLFGDFPTEFATTRRFLERYPGGNATWAPHEKSMPLARLATHVADIVNRGTMVLTTEGLVIGARAPITPLDSADALVSTFDANVSRFTEALPSATFAALAEPWTVRAGDRVMMERPRREMLRVIMMSHLVHHRAQLGVYYRLLGVAIPGTYGPSADEQA